MRFKRGAPFSLLLLLLNLLTDVLEVKGQERGFLQEALRALDLPLDTDGEPHFLKNHAGVLITRLLVAVHCAERTGASQDACEKVSASS